MKLYPALFVSVFCGVLTQDNIEKENQMINEVKDNGNWKILYRLLTDCAKTSYISVCLKMKVVTFLDRIVSLSAPLQINDYISFVRDPAYKEGPYGRAMKPLSEAQMEESLPRATDERSSRLDEMIEEKLGNFLQSRSLQMSIPADVFEGKKDDKKKGGGLLLAAGAAMAAMMAQTFMGKVALIAGKALVIAKVALAISAIIGLKKLFGSSGGESHQVVYAKGSHDHGGWQGRAFTSDHPQAHDIAYKAQKPKTQAMNDSHVTSQL